MSNIDNLEKRARRAYRRLYGSDEGTVVTHLESKQVRVSSPVTGFWAEYDYSGWKLHRTAKGRFSA